MSVAQHLAEAGFDFQTLTNNGVSFAILAFILVKLEPRLRQIETSIDRLAKALMLTKIAHPDANHSGKEEAREILRELEEKTGRREK